jgi:A/G-specific adenine glycosylase
MMELGATVCLPRNPLCLLCPVSTGCQAREQGNQAQLPIKLRSAAPVRIEAKLLVIERAGKILLRKRRADSQRLNGFWELPSAEELPKAREQEAVGSFRHSITNHNYVFTVVRATLRSAPSPFEWLEQSRLDEEPLSTTTRKALRLLGGAI